MIISDWGTYVWFWIELEAWQAMSIRPFDWGVYLEHIWYSRLMIKTKPLDENQFCKLRNELSVIDFTNVTWNLVHVLFGSLMHFLVCISSIFWCIFSYFWFYNDLVCFIKISWYNMFLLLNGWYSCWFYNFWKYLWAMIPNSNSTRGLSLEFWAVWKV